MYTVETQAAVSDGDVAPFWFTNNRYGLSTTDNESGYLRIGVKRDITADSLRKWAIGYGADIVLPHHFTSDFVVQQLYGELKYHRVLLTVGAKQLPMEFSNNELSTGDMAMGINARPIPQIRLELPDYLSIPGTNKWMGVRAHIAYGWMTDNNWQRSFISPNNIYSANVRYHSKSIFFNFGKKDVFPLTFEGGIATATQFGGEAWNLKQRPDDTTFVDLSHVKLNNGPRGYWNALFFGGKDPNDGDFKNTEGNHVGSWHGSLTYHGKGWSVRAYFEHYFEDHSQLFFQYGWKDMTWGIETHLPPNPFVSTFVLEHLSTKDQTSAVYHDATDALPVQISGRDKYYSHQIYNGWEHWGMSIGNPLFISPVYHPKGFISMDHTRFKATHLGIAGDPTPQLHYRLLYTHMRSWGTYDKPLIDTQPNDFLLTELSFKPRRMHGWTFMGAFGMNHGEIIPNSVGGSLTIRKEGLLR